MTHQLIQSQCDAERREHPRNVFNATQLIAPFHDDRPPESGDYFTVRCNDLTPKGFSFFLEKEPDFKELVVSFQMPSGKVLVHAEVRNIRKVLLFAESGRLESPDDPAACNDSCNDCCEDPDNPSPQEKGVPMTLVGCRFTGKRKPRLESSQGGRAANQ